MAMNPDYQRRREFARECIPLDVRTQNEWFKFIGIKRPKVGYVKPILQLIKETEFQIEDKS